ncbi:hypothetical protein EBU95_14680 [bacterium]|nr:hypothetical protein [bacterium]
MHHGYWSYCKTGNCKVCKTEWPVKQKTPLEVHLEKTGYYKEYITVDNKILPKGVCGKKLLDLYAEIKPEYEKLFGKITR